jgi:molybdopterin-guanine dinucleotide biosynthesis protein A
MGTDKALLQAGGRSLLQRQFETASSIAGSADRVRVSGNGHGLPCWLDDEPGGGPLSGVATALARTQAGGGLLFLPVDMPLLNADLLKRLKEANGDEIVTHFRGYEMPFVLFNGPIVLALCRKLARENESLRAFFSCLSVHELDVADNEHFHFLNANTAEDWRRFHDFTDIE